MAALFIIAVCSAAVWFVVMFILAVTMDIAPGWMQDALYVLYRLAQVIGIASAVLFGLGYALQLTPWHIEIGRR